jgi:hypothetical protein
VVTLNLLYIRSKKKQFKKKGNKMKKTNITLSIALAAVFSSSVAFAEVEVTGKIVHESAAFTSAGQGIGATTTWNQNIDTHGQDVMKTETSARIYIDGESDELHEGSTYHVELQGFIDGEGVDKYDGNESYTQRDALREAYIDADTNGFSIRAGKQQVVWGTADGMKLLDAINPTDYSEMAQNQMEDSRIPVWMLNAETETTDGGSFQVVLSESKSSKIAGLGIGSAAASSHTNGNAGNAFIMKGVDTMTGKVNGFLNIAPGLARAAEAFESASTAAGGLVAQSPTVADFNDATVSVAAFNAMCTGNANAVCMYEIVNLTTGQTAANGYGNAWSAGANLKDTLNLTDAVTQSDWDVSNPDSMFEYLHLATFGTFDAFVGMDSVYRVEHDAESEGNVALKYKNSTPDGLNYSLNYINGLDTNPYIDLSWETQAGVKLYENSSTAVGEATVRLSTTSEADGTLSSTVGGSADGGDAGTVGSDLTKLARMVMTEKLARIQSLGGSFDTAIETAQLGPVVIRGEVLYQADVQTPVITRKATDNKDLEHGFFTAAFKNQDTDYLKYVIGADITALTNMMVSAQFIQIVNLDYVNEGSISHTDTWRYTGDTAAMHLTNGLQAAKEFKEFYSLFLSKPFGASGEHRWNNILMAEDGGGYWNRLDAEFSIDDDTQVTVELNQYFGDENTQFGQLSKSSNIQAGFKYSF